MCKSATSTYWLFKAVLRYCLSNHFLLCVICHRVKCWHRRGLTASYNHLILNREIWIVAVIFNHNFLSLNRHTIGIQWEWYLSWRIVLRIGILHLEGILLEVGSLFQFHWSLVCSVLIPRILSCVSKLLMRLSVVHLIQTGSLDSTRPSVHLFI